MPESKNASSLHWVLGAALLLIGLFVVVALVGVNSQADNIDTQTTITNEAPTVVDVFINVSAYTFSNTNSGAITTSTITPAVGATVTINVNGSVHDPNGASDITLVDGTFYRSGVTSACSVDNNDCYKDAACSTQADTRSQNPSNEYLDYTCGPYNITYWADSTDAGGAYVAQNWVAGVGVQDNALGTDLDETTTREMATSADLLIGANTIDYGTLAKGVSTTAGNNYEQVSTQNGNDVTSLNVSSSADMLCSNLGSIEIGSQRHATSNVGYGSGTNLTTVATDTGLDVTYRTHESVANTGSLWWNIAIPSNNISGVCSGVTVITEIAA